MERRTLAEIPQGTEKPMTPEAQRIAIAEVCGWLQIRLTEGEPGGIKPPFRGWVPLPEYTEDLNAMHEVEKTMPDAVHRAYFYRLADGNSPWHYRMASMAPASQRAEMYLKTIGKWTDE